MEERNQLTDADGLARAHWPQCTAIKYWGLTRTFPHPSWYFLRSHTPSAAWLSHSECRYDQLPSCNFCLRRFTTYHSTKYWGLTRTFPHLSWYFLGPHTPSAIWLSHSESHYDQLPNCNFCPQRFTAYHSIIQLSSATSQIFHLACIQTLAQSH